MDRSMTVYSVLLAAAAVLLAAAMAVLFFRDMRGVGRELAARRRNKAPEAASVPPAEESAASPSAPAETSTGPETPAGEETALERAKRKLDFRPEAKILAFQSEERI